MAGVMGEAFRHPRLFEHISHGIVNILTRHPGSQLLPVRANGCPAFGQYKPDPAGGHAPWGLQVLEISAGQITGFHCFLDSKLLFPAFGLPAHLSA